jgi:hypothetical protein
MQPRQRLSYCDVCDMQQRLNNKQLGKTGNLLKYHFIDTNITQRHPGLRPGGGLGSEQSRLPA